MDTTASRPPASPPTAPASPAPVAVRTWPHASQSTLATLVVALLVGLVTHTLLFGSIQRPAESAGVPPLIRLDLNRATHAELRHLPGVGEKMADRIDAYRLRKGRFESVDDLRKVEGIGPLTIERLRPWLFVAAPPPKSAPEREAAAAPNAAQLADDSRVAANEVNLTDPINVNCASVADLQKLPGIGPKLSQRIVEVRSKELFKTVDDLRRVPGIGPKTLAKVRPYVVVNADETAAR